MYLVHHNLPTPKSSVCVSESFKLVGIMSSFSTSAFKAIKPFLAAQSDVLMPEAYSNSF